MEPRRTMYGVSHDNPDVTPPARCRYDACIEVDEGFRPEGEIGVQTLGGGRYACAEFAGPSTEIHTAWMKLCDWLAGQRLAAGRRRAARDLRPRLRDGREDRRVQLHAVHAGAAALTSAAACPWRE